MSDFESLKGELEEELKEIRREIEKIEIQQIEDTVFEADYLKHLATLSSGSILLLVIFLKEITQFSAHPLRIYVSIILFIVCIVCSAAAHLPLSLLRKIVGAEDETEYLLEAAVGLAYAILFIASVLSFIGAFIVLSSFVFEILSL